MKRLLLLGGMTPEATTLYYDTINRVVRSKFGARHNASLYMYSANLDEMIRFAGSGNWSAFAKVYTDAIEPLVGNIDGLVVCSIFAHKVARSLSSTSVPLLHIADYAAKHIKSKYPQIHTLGLIGPQVTMEESDPDFFKGRLESPQHAFKVLVPEMQADREEVNRGMMEEVAKGLAAVTPETKAMFIRQARKLLERGSQAIILGSTDLGFVIREEDLGEDTVVIEPASVHATEVALWALGE